MQQHDIISRPRGFFTFAQNTNTTDYVRLAYALALSLKASQIDVPYLSIGITPGTRVDERYVWAFDNIIEIPWGDHAADSDWKLENEWKAIHISPYDETIKLDTDMLFFNDIGSWWEQLSSTDFSICNSVVNYRSETVTSDWYRKVIASNHLPNVYTAFMYFKKTDYSYAVFDLVKYIFWNWQKFFEEFLLPDSRPDYVSTDIVFALALKILDEDGHSYASCRLPTFTHMKSKLQGWTYADTIEDWTLVMNTFFNPNLECKIGNYLQYFPLHYHIKTWLTDEILEHYERHIDR